MTEPLARQFLDFLNSTGSPYHSAKAAANFFEQHAFKRFWLDRQKPQRGDLGYLLSPDGSSIFAFRKGKNFDARRSRCILVAAHTDSPALKLRPSYDMSVEGMRLLGCELYGGGKWYSWFDRGLGVCGKVVYKAKSKQLKEVLVRIDKPVAYVPSVAIHLETQAEREAFRVDTEHHLRPVICSAGAVEVSDSEDEKSPLEQVLQKYLPMDDYVEIVDQDLYLMDATPSRLAGIADEFVESPRLDNLLSVFAGMTALQSASEKALDGEDKDLLVFVAFNNEEIGSETWSGARSQLFQRWMVFLEPDFELVLERSLFISSDSAHGLHPNFPEKHQAQHKATLTGGVVVKTNCKGRYTTEGRTRAMLRFLAEEQGLKIQDFVVRNDSSCGSTIGPILASRYGCETIDVGAPQWAMHCCRELCALQGLKHLQQFLSATYTELPTVMDNFVPAL